MKRTHSKNTKYRPTLEELKNDDDMIPVMDDYGRSVWTHISNMPKPMTITSGPNTNPIRELDIREGYEIHDKLPRRPDVRPSRQRVAEVMKSMKPPPIPLRPNKIPSKQDIIDWFDGNKTPLAPNKTPSKQDIEDFFNVNPTDLNSIYSSPEILYNPAGSMSYLNPQDPLIPRQIFSNTPYINAEPSLSNPIYKNPLNPYLISIMNATAIKPVKKVVDSLISSSIKDDINYDAEFTKLPTQQDIKDYYDTYSNDVIKGDVEDINFARKELINMKSSKDSFFDGADLDRPTLDSGDTPISSYEKMKSATSSSFDNYSNKAIDNKSVVNEDDIGSRINGLNLAVLPEGNELLGRTNNSYMDPYFNTNTNDLKSDLISSINFNNLLLGTNSIYSRPKDLDLIESNKEDGVLDNNGRPNGGSINFKTLNKTAMAKNFRSKANKWTGTGIRQTLQPTLSDVRGAKILVKIPNVYYKGNQTNLLRRSNQTQDLINTQYEP